MSHSLGLELPSHKLFFFYITLFFFKRYFIAYNFRKPSSIKKLDLNGKSNSLFIKREEIEK